MKANNIHMQMKQGVWWIQFYSLLLHVVPKILLQIVIQCGSQSYNFEDQYF